jgi:hypothetical protein
MLFRGTTSSRKDSPTTEGAAMTFSPNNIKDLSRICLHRFGLINTFSWYNRNRFQILFYHRFTDSKGCDYSGVLENQCAYISEQFTPVSMSQIADHLGHGASLPPRAVATTIDDGYRDFLTVAFPLFHAHKIPVTVYLITDFLDGRLWPWWNKVDYAVQHTSRRLSSNIPYSLIILAGGWCAVPTRSGKDPAQRFARSAKRYQTESEFPS